MDRYSFDEYGSDDDETLLFNTAKYLQDKAEEEARDAAERASGVQEVQPRRGIVEVIRGGTEVTDSSPDRQDADFDSEMRKVRAQTRIMSAQHDAKHAEHEQQRRATNLRKVEPSSVPASAETRGGKPVAAKGVKASSARAPPSSGPVQLTSHHRIIALEDEIKGLNNQVQHQGRALTRLTEENEKQARLITSLNQKIDREASETKRFQQQLKLAEAQVATLKRELDVSAASARGSKQTDSPDAPPATTAALKARVMELEQQLSGQGGAKESMDMQSLQQENKKLDQQRVELLLCIRKQNKLIEVLRRQKLHLEAAKLLELTESDFTRALEITDT